MFNELDARFMRAAIDEALKAGAAGDVPVGAIVARAGELVASGRNTREAERDPLGHAELNALAAAARRLGDWRLDGCTLYATLEPCAMCAAAAAQARVERIVFGCYDAKAGCCASVYRISEDPALGLYTRADGGLLEDECAALIKNTFSEAR